MLTAAQFIAIRGEFSNVYATDPTRIQAALDAAYRQTDETLFGDETDEAAMWLAAHLLAADPLGQAARIVGKKALETTLYMRERMRLESIYAGLHALSFGGTPPCL